MALQLLDLTEVRELLTRARFKMSHDAKFTESMIQAREWWTAESNRSGPGWCVALPRSGTTVARDKLLVCYWDTGADYDIVFSDMSKRYVDMSELRPMLVNYALTGEMWDLNP